MKTSFEFKFKNYKDFEEFCIFLSESDTEFDVIDAPKSWYKRWNE